MTPTTDPTSTPTDPPRCLLWLRSFFCYQSSHAMTPTTPPGYEEQLSKNDSSLCFWWRISKNVWKIWSSWRWVCFWRTARHLDWLWLRKLFWQDPFASPPRPRASSHFIHSPSPLCPRGAPPPRGWAGPIDGWSSLPNPRGTRPGERTGLHLLRQPGLQWVRSFFCYQSSHAQTTTLKTRSPTRRSWLTRKLLLKVPSEDDSLDGHPNWHLCSTPSNDFFCPRHSWVELKRLAICEKSLKSQGGHSAFLWLCSDDGWRKKTFGFIDGRRKTDGRRRFWEELFDDGETGTFWIVMKWDLRLWEVETRFDCAW